MKICIYFEEALGSGKRLESYGLGIERHWEVIDIECYEFLIDLYGFLSNQNNHGVYVIKMFNAAGSRHFHLENIYRHTNGYLEEERRYVIDRANTPE